jgi:hypothetical protein
MRPTTSKTLSCLWRFVCESRASGLHHSLLTAIDRLGVAAYCVSVTTLEEVFIRVGHGMSPTEHGTPRVAPALDSKALESSSVAPGGVTINIKPAPSARGSGMRESSTLFVLHLF